MILRRFTISAALNKRPIDELDYWFLASHYDCEEAQAVLRG